MKGFENVYVTYSKGELLSYDGQELIDKLMNAGVNVVYEELDNGSHDIIAAGTKSEEAQDAWKRIADYLKTYHIQKSDIA